MTFALKSFDLQIYHICKYSCMFSINETDFMRECGNWKTLFKTVKRKGIIIFWAIFLDNIKYFNFLDLYFVQLSFLISKRVDIVSEYSTTFFWLKKITISFARKFSFIHCIQPIFYFQMTQRPHLQIYSIKNLHLWSRKPTSIEREVASLVLKFLLFEKIKNCVIIITWSQ